MKVSIKDLEQAMEYIKRRSTDIAIRLNTDTGVLEISFSDVDNNRVTIHIHDSEGSLRARISQQDYLDIAVKSLKKP